MKDSILTLVAAFSFMFVAAQDGKLTHISFNELPYPAGALEVFIDKQTMEIHHGRHHRAYYNNFLKAIADEKIPLEPIEKTLATISKYSTFARNNGGGHFNHNLFWEIMSPNGGGLPSGKLMEAIVNRFGSFDAFKSDFEKKAAAIFGSGWAWLSVSSDGKLFVSTTANQDNPLMDVVAEKGTPILGLDVWEHAYYLRYQNKRADYIANFWKVVNWGEVEKRYAIALGQL